MSVMSLPTHEIMECRVDNNKDCLTPHVEPQSINLVSIGGTAISTATGSSIDVDTIAPGKIILAH